MKVAAAAASKMKVLAPIDARGLAWLAFSCRCCGIERPPSEWDAAAFAAAAQLLTSQPPYVVPFSAIRVQVLQRDTPIWHLMRGCRLQAAYATSL